MKPKLKITGEHISTDGKNKCIHYSDGVVVIEPITEGDKLNEAVDKMFTTEGK